jgi:hypothetical protein
MRDVRDAIEIRRIAISLVWEKRNEIGISGQGRII